ncbi:SDR family oxidoreductase [Massilia sp. IC2-477]|uniref:SDR family NAD(P)-dependent oxidoreductase n=1 Tax=Massilia sp. IC2-477 TaxID=2887198 RepID=UPI001D129C77|nr:SDR family oxidoreductase [Massilia sp. IC2-477]MCC2957288.1 SDR family oxidoreductase [Massilia sp. IC2-477]
MEIEFINRKVLVTGSTSGIGFAAARGFLAAGAEVVINGRSQASVASALERLQGLRAKASGFAGDMSVESDVSALFEAHPHFDIVVNNVGIYGLNDFFETDDAEWNHYFQTNVMSGVRLARHYAQKMVSQGWGRIVFISSESAINIPADMIHYGFTKTAQLAVSRGLAKRLAGTGVTVNAVLPGPTLSEGVADLLRPDAEKTGTSIDDVAANFIANHRSSSIIRRPATVDEVANMILYISSAHASATTGSALRVDGGVVENIL